jgi:putative peptidoglycan lipid II flippase
MSLLFMGGQFDYNMARQSALALVYYSFGLACVALVRVLAPAFYAMKDTRTPVLTALVAFLLNLGFSLWLMGPLQHGGLALASSLAATGNMLLLFWFLHNKIGSLGAGRMFKTATVAAISSIPMGLSAWWLTTLYDWSLPGQKVIKALLVAGVVLVAVLVYGICSFILKSEEVREFSGIIKRKLGR